MNLLHAIQSQNGRAWLTTALGAASFVGVCGVTGRKKLLPERLSRKLMHIGTGPLYLLCWPLYDASATSPWLCATVPLLASAAFLLVGAGALEDYAGLVPGATRSGRREELLRGPFLYGVVHSVAAALLWRRPAAVISLAVLCGGDGLAEVVGRSVRSPRLPWNSDKSVAGSLACAAGGAAFAIPLLRYFVHTGAITLGVTAGVAARVAFCAAVGALVESLPLLVDGGDNITVPVTTALASALVFGA